VLTPHLFRSVLSQLIQSQPVRLLTSVSKELPIAVRHLLIPSHLTDLEAFLPEVCQSLIILCKQRCFLPRKGIGPSWLLNLHVRSRLSMSCLLGVNQKYCCLRNLNRNQLNRCFHLKLYSLLLRQAHTSSTYLKHIPQAHTLPV